MENTFFHREYKQAKSRASAAGDEHRRLLGTVQELAARWNKIPVKNRHLAASRKLHEELATASSKEAHADQTHRDLLAKADEAERNLISQIRGSIELRVRSEIEKELAAI